jgi:DNA-directed RNA polymerase specialized sigma24 family protein
MSDVTRILSAIDSGDPQAAAQLLPLVYDELRKLAAVRLAQEQPGQTLQATALVHEAYLRLVGPAGPAGLAAGTDGEKSEVGSQKSADSDLTSDLRSPTSEQSRPAVGTYWHSRGHFFAAAAEAMRRILIEQARRKSSLKAGGRRQRVDLADAEPEIQGPQLNLLALDAALDQLAARDARAAELVKLRFFAGLTMPQAALALGVSLATVENDWAYAKSWLRLQIADADDRPS